ncbi:PKD domain protein [Polaribacter aquimarinus]|nr:PKD domain protein [Polaribacter aquimarinus]
MKKIKNIYKICIVLLVLVACTDNLRDISFVENMAPPSNVAAIYDITQDNTGLVTITPSADGAVGFKVFFGDTTKDPETLTPGQSIDHTYAEGTYDVKVVAYNLGGDETELIQQLVVSFKAPQNLVVVIENDKAISKQVNITANADFAAMFEFDSGETGITQPVATANIGNTINYQYKDAGKYSVKVTAKGGAIATTEYTAEFEVTAILAPIASAVTPPVRNATDVISIFSDAYTNISGVDYNPSWNQATIYSAFDLNGDAILQYSNLNYQGIDFSNNLQDASSMEMLHIDVWTADATSIDIYPISSSSSEFFVTKQLKTNEWNSFDIPLSEFTSQGLVISDIKQFKFVGSGTVFIDNLYFYKAPTTFPKVFDDFEGNGTITTWFGDSAGADTSFANPFKNTDNSSNAVLKYEDTGGQYANVRFDVAQNFDFSVKKKFSLKVYVPSSSVTGSSPNQVSLKLQDGTAAQPWVSQTEIIKPIQLDTWQTLTFDFENDATAGSPNPLNRSDFNRVVLQVNGENNNDNVIAYIDDIAWGDDLFTGPIPHDDFEGGGNITTWAGDSAGLNTSLANPFKNSDNNSNTVLEYDDTGGQYANIRFDADANFNMEKHTFSFKIYVASTSVTGGSPNQVSLKLQDGTASQPWVLQTEVIKPIQLDTWQTVTFDFKNDTTVGAADPLNRTDFNRVVIQVNGENNNDNVKAYIDDFKYQ